MAASPPYVVEGIRQLRAALVQLGIDEQDFKDAHADVAQYVGATAALAAPRRSGMLASSWRSSGTKTAATVRFGGAAVPYGNPVHWGTGARPGLRGPHNIRRNPFAWNAARETEETWFATYLATLQRMADDAMQKVRPT